MSPHDRLRRWLFEDALPFWAAAGHEGALGASEHLTLDGVSAQAPFKRMRVQARQVFVFAQAALLGWPDGRRLATDGYAFITRHGAEPGCGWVRRLSPSGAEVLDPTIDLYDQAFVLFAFAWQARLTHDPTPIALARRTLDMIHTRMRAPHGGYHNTIPAEPGPRQQNPHMHLLEAMLALYETSRDRLFLSEAATLVALFRDRLFDRTTHTLGEFFADDWTQAADHVEPGHQYEWVALLDQYAALAGTDLSPEIDHLYDTALYRGTDPATALVHDVITRNGTPLRRSTRLWPQTEALKAHLVMRRRGRETHALVAQTTTNILDRFLMPCPRGTWIDQLDEHGHPAADRIPTSSFYHLMTAYAALDAAS